MATATRKPAAKRTRTRKPAARTTPQKIPATQVEVDTLNQTVEPFYTDEERQALLLSYNSLKVAGLPIPAEIEGPVGRWIEEENRRREAEAAVRAEQREAMAAVNAKGPWYVRNLTNVPFSLRLDRQTERRRIELKPRGNPGDLHPLEDTDRQDPILQRNMRIGAVEVVPAGEANAIMDKQTYNMGPRVHTPTALLRRPDGKPYEEGAVKVEAEFHSRGVTVATLDPSQMQGQVTDKEVASNRTFGGLTRTQAGQRETVSEFVPTGGNPAIISNGPVPPGGLAGTSNAQAKIADDLARRRGLGGPGAGLGGLQVTIAPTQHE